MTVMVRANQMDQTNVTESTRWDLKEPLRVTDEICGGRGALRERDDMTTMGGLTQQWLRGRRDRGELGAHTVKVYRCALDSFAVSYGHRPVRQLGVSDMERWMASRGAIRPSTRRKDMYIVRMFCRWLVRERHIRSNPCDELAPIRRPDSLPRALPHDAIVALFDACPNQRARAIVALMVHLGLRCCEVERLCVEDWDRRDDVIRVRGKNDNERWLPMVPECATELVRYLGHHPAASGPFIRSYADDSRALSAVTISIQVGRWMRDAGLKTYRFDGVSAHALRHTAASDVLDASGDLRVVQEMLGHRHLNTTAIYLRRASAQKMREAMAGRTYAGGAV